MNDLAWHQKHGRLSVERYLKFLDQRPEEERWQLIDGVAVMMPPPAVFHQRIVLNLQRLLNDALARHRPDLIAIHELGLIVPGLDDFRPVADLAVINEKLSAAVGTGSYIDKFYLTAEVLSPSNRKEYMTLKRGHYMQHPENLYCLAIAQNKIRVEAYSKRTAWQRTVLTGPQDIFDLPEFGLSCTVGEIYRGTPFVA